MTRLSIATILFVIGVMAASSSPSSADAAASARSSGAAGAPDVSAREAWVDGSLRSVALFGEHLVPGASCQIQAIRNDGSACYSADLDGANATMATDSNGRLVSSRINMYEALPLVWPCLNGICSFGIRVDDCGSIATFRVSCAGETYDYDLVGVQHVTDPPSASLAVELADPPGEGRFDLLASLILGSTPPAPQCSVRNESEAEDSAGDVLGRAAEAINSSATCGSVEATIEPARTAGASPGLSLRGMDRTGAQLLPAVHVEPGQGRGRCYTLSDLGDPATGHARPMAIEWHAGPGGVLGGEISVTEVSPLGTCRIVAETREDTTELVVSGAVRDAFLAPGIPGPADCPASMNPRDVTLQGNQTLITLATGIEVCVDDPGLGFTLRGAGLHSAHPIAHCNGARDECIGRDGVALLLDATASSDPNAPDAGLAFTWYDNYGEEDQSVIGTGGVLQHVFPVGHSEVELIVMDAEGLVDQTTCTADVTDTVPPTVAMASAHPAVLYPPNHEMVPVSVDLEAHDTCGDVTIELLSVDSSEPDDAPGPTDGATVFDIQGADVGQPDVDLLLRAERDASGPGRGYLATYSVRDQRYNAQDVAIEVTVPVAIDGTVDPIEVLLDAAAGTVHVEWSDQQESVEYDVVRGDLSLIRPAADVTHLGAIDCLEVGTHARRTTDTVALSAGAAAFYLVSSVRDEIPVGFTNASAVKPRYVPACRISGGPVPDPERNADTPTAWGWLLDVSSQALEDHLDLHHERLVDVDRVGPDRFLSVQVRNTGETYHTAAPRWESDLSAGEILLRQIAYNLRVLDLEPFVVNGETRFDVSMIPNDGKRAKETWWDFDLVGSEIPIAINDRNMRLIDLEVYEKNGQTRFAYVGIANEGVDEVTTSIPIYNATFQELDDLIVETGGRLIDIEVRPDGNFSGILVEGDGTFWWWGAGSTVEDIEILLGNQSARLVDIERFWTGADWRYAIVAIDNALNQESRRLRNLVNQAFGDPAFGTGTIRGFLVKEVGGPVIAEVGSRVPFNPASTLKLLPYLYAIQEVDRGNAGMVTSEIEWWSGGGDCFTPGAGTLGTALFADALPTLMWYSHNRTLEAFFDLYPPFDGGPGAETLTSRAQQEWGMGDTVMYPGCPTDESPWMGNRSTLRDLARLYDGVGSGAWFAQPEAGRGRFFGNMINIIQGTCSGAVPPNTMNCRCPQYVDEADCVGNFYQSPYLVTSQFGGTVTNLMNPAQAPVITSEAPSRFSPFDIGDFARNTIIRGKGGGWNANPGMRSDSLFVTLPFKDGTGAWAPRSYIVTFYANNWDFNCGGAPDCAAKRAAGDAALGILKAELLRIPVRRAWATW